MELHEFSFPSTDGKTDLHGVEWLPEGEVQAVLQISHGVAEHILRYAPLAEFLTKQGVAVVGHDHLGHGTSVPPGAPRLYFGPLGSWDTVVEDLYRRSQLARARFPGVPLFLLGHSMGSFLLRSFLLAHPSCVEGAIIVGTGEVPCSRLAAALAGLECRRIGETQPSPFLLHLVFRVYNRRFAPNRTESDWISKNPENVDAYCADPLCGGDPSAGLTREMLRSFAQISSPAALRQMDPETPILFLSGAMDPVGSCGKGVRRVFHKFQSAGVQDLTCILYSELRHEILNEAERERVYGDLLRWLLERLPHSGVRQREAGSPV